MLLHRRPCSSGRFLVTIICTLFHQVEGFPALVPKIPARVVLDLPTSSPILSSHDPSWFDDAAATLAIRSSDAVHENIFIPTIVTMGVLVIFCIYCCYQLVVIKDTVHTRGAYNERVVSSQDAVEGQGTRGLTKTTRGSVASTSASLPASDSVRSDNMLHQLQRRREEEHLREQQQDPYEQYIASNQGYPTPHPSLLGLAVQGVQPQPPSSARLPIAQSRSINAGPGLRVQQDVQQSESRRGIPHIPSARSSSTRGTSDVLSYMTPPEARQPPLPSSRPQNRDYFSPRPQQPAAGTGSLFNDPSTHGNIAHSLPANHNPASGLPSTTNLDHTANAQSYANQLPGYEENVTTLHSEKQHSRS